MKKNPGKRIEWLTEVDSTNRHMSEKARKQKLEHGDVIITHNQTRGKGLGQNDWMSEEGKNITMSVYWRHQGLSAEKPFYVTIFTALGLCDFLNSYTDRISIKWPNDILHEERKLCGILIENSITGALVSSSIVGIGLNVNQKTFASHLPNPTSLSLICNRTFNIEHLLYRLLDCLDKRYHQFEKQEYSNMKSEYLKKLFLFNEYREFNSIHGKITGKITNVLDSGELVFHKKNESSPLLFSFKEIEYPFTQS
jgi:BirA family biotin operon repressor/biotin-[acetyl-CoA-carboxylase] ligase